MSFIEWRGNRHEPMKHGNYCWKFNGAKYKGRYKMRRKATYATPMGSKRVKVANVDGSVVSIYARVASDKAMYAETARGWIRIKEVAGE